ncbi:MAG TPA: GNAT family N-acetyltransferase, partial [Vicinamibacteria bacterium]|nr:GNAT family N-acetyltransferase [Vicinamibacteria bacterium]
NSLVAQLVRRFYGDIWNRYDRSAKADLLTDDFRFRGSLGRDSVGLEAFAEYVESVHEALGEYRCEIDELVCEGERAFARMTFSGIHRGPLLGHPPTGKRVAWAGAAFFHARGEKLESLWVLGDLDSLRDQLQTGPWEIRRANTEDVEALASLHAESWQSAYRGLLSDDYLDQRALADRRSVWKEKLAQDAATTLVLLAFRDGEPAGFVCAILDQDETWGALLDNLHVLSRFQGKGLGKRLMIEAARWVSSSRPRSPLHLWVIGENEEARSFYERLSGKPLDRKLWTAPDGKRVDVVRYVWNDATCVE